MSGRGPMHSYQAYGLTFLSDIAFPGLPPAAGGRAECSVRFEPPSQFAASSGEWIDHRRTPDGSVWLSLGKRGAGHVVRLPGIADFLVSGDGCEVNAYPQRETAAATTRQLFLNRVVPLLLARRGQLVLHAGAVASGGRAVAFMGPSGRGKSTLTTHLCSRGLTLLSDDCVVARERGGELAALAGHPEVWLRNDTVSALFGAGPLPSLVPSHCEKTALSSLAGQMSFGTAPAVLRRIYLLAPPDHGHDEPAIRISALSPQEAFVALVSNCLKWDLTDGEMLRAEFLRLGSLARRPLFYRLAYRRDFAALPVVGGAVLADLAA